MTDTPKTPIQFPDDDRLLLRQLFGLVQNLVSDMHDLKDDMQELKADVKQLKADVKQLKTDVQQLKTDVQQLKTDVQQLKTDVQQLKTDVQQLKTEMIEVKDRLTALENNRDTVGRLDKLVLVVAENSQELKDLRQELAAFREEVQAHLERSDLEFSSYRSVTKTAIYDLSFRQEYIESRLGRLGKIEQRLDLLEKKVS